MIQFDLVTVRCGFSAGNFENEECSFPSVSTSEEEKPGGTYYAKGKTRLRMKLKQKLVQRKAEPRNSW